MDRKTALVALGGVAVASLAVVSIVKWITARRKDAPNTTSAQTHSVVQAASKVSAEMRCGWWTSKHSSFVLSL